MKNLQKMFALLIVFIITTAANAQDERKEKCDFLDENKVAYNIKSDGTVEVSYAKLKKGKYAYDDEYVVLCKGDIVIPAVVSNDGVEYKVTSIADHAFDGSKNITSVQIGENVTSIGRYAFTKSQDLATVTMSDNVTDMLVGVFEACPILSSVQLSNSLTNMEGSIFSECTALKEITLPNSLEKLMSKTFNACSSLETVVFGKSIKEIGNDEMYGAENDVFRDCTALVNITFNDKLTLIGNGAFQGCKSLINLTFPAKLKVISDYAFAACENIKTLDFSKCTKLEKIGNSAFGRMWSGGATQVENLILPDCVNKIGHSAFKGSESLVNVKLPKNLENIGIGTFEDCIKLAEVTIPGRLEKLPENLFSGCTGLKKIIFTAGGKLSGDDGVFNGCAPEDIYVNRPVFCLSSCDKSNLKVLEIGENITEWNNDYVGDNLEKIVTYIDNPSQLIPEFTDDIFNNATLYVPKGLQYVYQDFTAEVWNKFAKIEEFGEVLKDGGIYYVVNNIEKTARVVFGEQMDDAKKNYSGSVDIPETVELNDVEYNVTSIGSYAFNQCEGLKSVTIPESITSIGKQTFSECKNIKNIELPEGLKYLGESCFEYCESLTEVIVPKNITKLEFGVFQECNKLAGVTLPTDLTSIGTCAFSGCVALPNIELPEGVTFIGNFAFNNCAALESIEIPAHVDSIMECTFSKCASLTKIELKNNIKKIMGAAFEKSGLQTVIIGSNVETICETAFSECQQLTNLVFEDANEPIVIDEGLAENKYANHSFNACPIEKLYIGRELKGFDGWADNFLEELTLGADLTEWHDNYCGSTCDKVIAKMELAMQLVPNFKDIVYETAVLEVPAGMADEYRSAEGWKNFKNIKEEGSALSIDSVLNGDVEIQSIYSVDGKTRTSLEKGLNIIKLADGKIVKLFVD